MSEWTRPAQPVRCVVELDKPLAVHRERGVLAQGDANANAIVAEVYSTAGKPYDLTGCTVQLIFVRPDNNALPAINAEISGNTATATLPDSAYAMGGMYSLRMQLSKNGAERTIVWIIGEVKGTDVDGIADPEHVISIGDIMASAKEAQTAASNANAAAQRANAGAERAEQLQIDASGLAGDSNKLGGKPPSYYLPAVNLLDNSDWRIKANIINQRGIQSGSTVQTWEYFFDRWKNRDAKITLAFGETGGATISGTNGWIYQITKRNYMDTAYTAAVMFNDGEILMCSGSDKNANASTQLAFVTNSTGQGIAIYRDAATNLETMIYPNGKTVMWIALYEGTYNADTLPPFVPPDATLELAKCMRYYQRLDDVAVVFGSVEQGSGEYFSSGFTYLVPMRGIPTLSILKIVSSANRYGIVNNVEFITEIDHLRIENSQQAARFITSKSTYAGCGCQFYEIELACDL